MNIDVMTEREIRAELQQLQAKSFAGNLTPNDAERMRSLKIALIQIRSAKTL